MVGVLCKRSRRDQKECRGKTTLPDHSGKVDLKNNDMPLLEGAPPHAGAEFGKIVHD
jgi:hypothetical protein